MAAINAFRARLLVLETIVLIRQNNLFRKSLKELCRLLSESIHKINVINLGLIEVARKKDAPRLMNNLNDRFLRRKRCGIQMIKRIPCIARRDSFSTIRGTASYKRAAVSGSFTLRGLLTIMTYHPFLSRKYRKWRAKWVVI